MIFNNHFRLFVNCLLFKYIIELSLLYTINVICIIHHLLGSGSFFSFNSPLIEFSDLIFVWFGHNQDLASFNWIVIGWLSQMA